MNACMNLQYLQWMSPQDFRNGQVNYFETDTLEISKPN